MQKLAKNVELRCTENFEKGGGTEKRGGRVL